MQTGLDNADTIEAAMSYHSRHNRSNSIYHLYHIAFALIVHIQLAYTAMKFPLQSCNHKLLGGML